MLRFYWFKNNSLIQTVKCSLFEANIFLQSFHDVLITPIRFFCKDKFFFHCEMTVRCLFVSRDLNSLIQTVKWSSFVFYVPTYSTSPTTKQEYAWELEPTSLRVIWPDHGRLIFNPFRLVISQLRATFQRRRAIQLVLVLMPERKTFLRLIFAECRSDGWKFFQNSFKGSGTGKHREWHPWNTTWHGGTFTSSQLECRILRKLEIFSCCPISYRRWVIGSI